MTLFRIRVLQMQLKLSRWGPPGFRMGPKSMTSVLVYQRKMREMRDTGTRPCEDGAEIRALRLEAEER